MSPIRRIYGGAQVCAPEGRDSSHSGEPIIYGRATRAPFRHSNFNCHLDFDIWNLLGQLQESGGGV